jgi:hypothetical protein
MKKIKLTQGKFALVDDDDFENLSKLNWFFSPNGYAYNPKHESIYMHRAIMGLKKGQNEKFVDHINSEKLDNRKQNLRHSDKYRNQQNRKIASNNTSGYKGVSFMKSKGKWWSKITVNKQRKFLGYFETALEAGVAYNNAAKKYFGHNAKLNNIGGSR